MEEKEKEIPTPSSEQTEPQPEAEKQSAPSPEEELARKLAEAERQVEHYKDLLLRKAAEFDNYKKRVESDTITLAKFAKADVLTGLLPVIDDFDRSLKQMREHKDAEGVAKGIELIYQKLMKFLEANGVRTMETVGKQFDVRYHDALLQVPREDIPPHTIVEEVEKGYLLDDRVIRHAKVIVSTAPGATDAGEVVSQELQPRAGESSPEGN
jgi:molecular chaperone GrpE